MTLPTLFLERMESLLGKKHFPLFLKTYQEMPVAAIRVVKDPQQFLTALSIAKIPWVENGHYISNQAIQSVHPYHLAGGFYIQEASAMGIVPMMDIQPHDMVLDIAAAPGSKATQIASYLANDGLLIANDVDAKRAQALMFNVERMGLTQVVVTQHDPEHLKQLLPKMFDKILIDAPCSGEAMFRKDTDAIQAWSVEHVLMCAVRQEALLESMVPLLRDGGTITYTTSTFSCEENEQLIKKFLKKHPSFQLVNHPHFQYFDQTSTRGIGAKLFPHLIKGEGGYVAILKHQSRPSKPNTFQHKMKNPMPKAWFEFAQETLKNGIIKPNFILNDRMWMIPSRYQFHSALHTLRAGVYMGEVVKNIFYPSHHLARVLSTQDVKRTIPLALNDVLITAYLRGEEFRFDIEDGWVLITVDGLSLGWGKASQGRIKNHYPKGLRLSQGRV